MAQLPPPVQMPQRMIDHDHGHHHRHAPSTFTHSSRRQRHPNASTRGGQQPSSPPFERPARHARPSHESPSPLPRYLH
ncbi:hypothetical protein EJ02DRAFT_450041 [Clathrospora elynae]|uniref:Uncharacterized protein n=1 Tax=Clathrospora elynae TaxID=706981 RepID=A0A6A5T272_9PLEO|nr:hypothetical protein EJ02DRAFT_450041 [Clathrospora elynae]